MKKPENEIGYYMGWFVAYLLVAGFTIYFAWLGKPVSWCSGAVDEHCFREWVSALGSWAAVPAAAVTVYYLYIQIRDTEKFQRRNIKISTAFETMRIEHFIKLNRAVEKYMDKKLAKRIDDLRSEFTKENIKSTIRAFEAIVDQFKRDEFSNAPHTFYLALTPDGVIDAIKNCIKLLRSTHKRDDFDTIDEFEIEIRHNIVSICDITVSHMKTYINSNLKRVDETHKKLTELTFI